MFKYIQNLLNNIILIIIATKTLLHIAINTSVIYLIYLYILYYITFMSNLQELQSKLLGVLGLRRVNELGLCAIPLESPHPGF